MKNKNVNFSKIRYCKQSFHKRLTSEWTSRKAKGFLLLVSQMWVFAQQGIANHMEVSLGLWLFNPVKWTSLRVLLVVEYTVKKGQTNQRWWINSWYRKSNVFFHQCWFFHAVTLSTFLPLPPPRWPNVPKRKSKNGQCSVKSMSGKHLSSSPSPPRFVVTPKQASALNSEQVSYKTSTLLMRWLN